VGLYLQAQETTSVVSELASVAKEEQALLQECLELLSRFSSLQVYFLCVCVPHLALIYFGFWLNPLLLVFNMQVEEQSLRCHLVQSASSSLTSVTVE
jgi:hypothetical protein